VYLYPRLRDATQEWTALLRGKSKCALPGFVIDQEQVIGLPKRAGRLTIISGAPRLGAHHQGPSPAIWSRVANCAKETLSRRGVVRRSIHLKRWLQRKSRWVPQPLFVIAKGGALDALAIVLPQPANQMRCAVEVNVNEDLLVHLQPRLFAFWLGFLRAPGTKINPLGQSLFFQRQADLVGF
jgi:hypothetical protein